MTGSADRAARHRTGAPRTLGIPGRASSPATTPARPGCGPTRRGRGATTARPGVRTRWVVSALAAALALGACGGADAPEPGAERTSPAPAGALGSVEVTSYPLAWVAERLAGSLLEVRFRAAEADDPAYWRPTAEQVVAMQDADLIVVNGAGYEPWLKDVSLPTSRLVDSTASARDDLIAVEGMVTHSHGAEGQHEHGGTAFTTWLDPTLLVEQARSVAAALERTWPDQSDLFADRLEALVADLEALDAEQSAATSSAAGRPVVFSHPVYQYLSRRYGLTGESLHWEPDAPPDAEQWARLEELRDRTGAAWMIWEAEPLPETSERLAGAGVRSVVVATGSRPPERGDLLDVLRRNAEALRTVYGTTEPAETGS